MRTEEIIVNGHGGGIREAMNVTEKAGEEAGLSVKEMLRLRLLAEELLGMMRGIVGEAEAVFWAENNEKRFELHLDSDVPLSQEMRKELISVSSKGENAAAKGFMGKIREMIAVIVLPRESGPTMASLGLMSFGSPNGFRAGSVSYAWSMNEYRLGVENRRLESEEAGAAWDELEKSIVANIADEVSVSINGSHVETVIYKEF
ncbi:MAG: hypothetical protein IJJ50_09345 [Lachnospiraceae bacterium]|nr:hypothetical protein [Lachnospiraceae bacterium]